MRDRRSSRLLHASLVALSLALGACAGASSAPRGQVPAPREVPDSVHEDEVLIEDALDEARDERRACPDRCEMAGAVCEAADRICHVIGELRDVSLAPRCDRARGACTDARERVSACGCSAEPRPTAE